MHAAEQFQYLAEAPSEVPGSLRILLLADPACPSHVVTDNIKNFVKLSKHYIRVLNTRLGDPVPKYLNERYDVIFIHYSICIIYDSYLPQEWRAAIRCFSGLKVVNIEDEYRSIDKFRATMHDLGVRLVFSVLDSPATMEKVYGCDILKDVQFYCFLPGYITPSMHIDSPPPIVGRPLDIVYRGRILPAQLGRLAYEKRAIGEQMLAVADKYQLKVDISSDEDSRIYGEAWLKFLMSGKAMLGVEGGASIFDFDGSLEQNVQAFIAAHPEAGFEEIWSALLQEHEGNVMFRTITPKFFEAIAAKTALLLYPGEYNGVLKPHMHYIPLARDGSNMDEVVEKLRDDTYLQAMVDRAYEDIFSRRELSAQFYFLKLDAVLASQYSCGRVGRFAVRRFWIRILYNRMILDLLKGASSFLAMKQFSATNQ